MVEVGIRQVEKSSRCADLELRRERKMCLYGSHGAGKTVKE